MNPIIATAGTDEKLEFCKQLGATHLINYKKESFKEKVAQITNKKGMITFIILYLLYVFKFHYRSICYHGFHRCILLERQLGI